MSANPATAGPVGSALPPRRAARSPRLQEPAKKGTRASPPRLPPLPAPAPGSALALALFPDVVDEAPVAGFLGAHEVVAVEGFLDDLDRLAGVLGVDLV